MEASEYDDKYSRLVVEYEEERERLDKEYKNNLSLLARDYAFSNNSVKVGDIISSKHGEKIVVDIIKYTSQCFRERPMCVYYGRVITKAGIPRKDKKKLRITQMEML
jgi:hypothetical protein